VGAAVSLTMGGGGSLSNIMWSGPRPTSVPSGILIHPAVWPQYTNVTDKTDNGLIAQGELFYKQSRKNEETASIILPMYDFL